MLLVGTYTRNTDSQGIYVFDDKSYQPLHENSGIDNPSWLVVHPQLPVVYAVNECTDFAGDSGAISCFSLNSAGHLELIQQQPSLGADPCHLCVDPSGQWLAVSNYSSGSLAVFPLDSEGLTGPFESLVQHTGKSVDPMRQQAPHVHSATLGATGQQLYIADLGLDKVLVYSISAVGSLNVMTRKSSILKPGAGPRHFCFSPDGDYAYLINELDNTLVSFYRDAADGSLTELASLSTLPADCDDASYCAHVAISADGKYLYGSNRGHDSLVVVALGEDGEMDVVQHVSSGGIHPRHFALTPDQSTLVVANRDSNNLVVFDRDCDSGQLSPAGQEVSVPAPVCLVYK